MSGEEPHVVTKKGRGLWVEGLGVDMSEVGGAQGSSRPAESTSPEQGPLWASGGPSSLHLVWGVQQQEAISDTGEGRGGSTQFGEATALPS